MIIFNQNKINYIEKSLIKLAKRSIKKSNYNSAISALSAASFIKYTFYKGYTDAFIENSIKELSNHIRTNCFSKEESDDTQFCVFYDCFTSDNRALTEQYIEALIANKCKFIYIHRRNLDSPVCSNIKQVLKKYKNATTIRVPSSIKGLDLSQWIYDTIIKSGVKKVLMQLLPYSVEECIAFSALPNTIKRFQINLTDHTFWVGSNCTDYSLEFRQYGCNLSLDKRGLLKEQILLMPFYPIMKSTSFAGFPCNIDDKIVFFSGGAPYKVIDSENTFFKLCKAIIDVCPNAIICFAGGIIDDKTILDSIDRFGLQGRMFALGHRHDIYEVFKRIDIYINTFPFGGGLMCQYAAQCAKPILNYKKHDIEEVISQKHSCPFTIDDFDSFIMEAKALYENEEYRINKGKELNSAVISKNEFDNNLFNSLLHQISPIPIVWNSKFKPLELDNVGMINYQNKNWDVPYKLYSILGNILFFIFPRVYISLQFHRIVTRIKKYLTR